MAEGMTRKELVAKLGMKVGDWTPIISLQSRNEILAEFDRLTTSRDSHMKGRERLLDLAHRNEQQIKELKQENERLIQDKGNLMIDFGKEMQRSSHAEQALDRICETMQGYSHDEINRQVQNKFVLYSAINALHRIVDYLDSQEGKPAESQPQIRIESTCHCGCSIYIVADKYKAHNQGGSLHSCQEKPNFAEEDRLRGILEKYTTIPKYDNISCDAFDAVIADILKWHKKSKQGGEQ